nr:unnamed protein product [Digitaria exilis]
MLVSVEDDSSGWQESPSQAVLFAEEIDAVRAVLGAALPEARVIATLSRCGGNTERAINALLDDSADATEVGPDAAAPKPVKAERDLRGTPSPTKVKAEALDEEVMGIQDSDGSSANVKSEPMDWSGKEPSVVPHRVKKEEKPAAGSRDAPRKGGPAAAASAAATVGGGISLVPRPKKRPREEVETIDLTTTHPVPYLNPRPIRALPPPVGAVTCDPRPILAVPPLDVQMYDSMPVRSPLPPLDVEMYQPRARAPAPPRPPRATAPVPVADMRMVVAPPDAEFGDFPEERDWLLVGKSYVPGLSTNRGRRRMDAGEIVHFAFPSYEKIYGGVKVSAKKAAALAEIVRFSTKRAGEIGKLSPDWTQCLVPLVNSSKVKIHGKIVFPTVELRLMQEILLYVSFYIHKSVFTEMGNSSCDMLDHANVSFSSSPLHQLLTLLKLKASNKDDFSLGDLTTRKLQRILRGNDKSGDESTPMLGQTFLEQGPDEQAISEAALNKLVGTAETFDLENNLEDLYSLLCFLHVEPWCNAKWWQKLIQKPYENGDDRGLKILKAILKPLMLRRTKETKDKIGNPILVLPPAHIEVVECEQSEHERDFYEALFRRSKVQFDNFVAQGSVLNNYANILELLLRLRQCCNHPFLVISRVDPQKYADLDQLAQRFLEGVQRCSGRQSVLPSRAYVEEVVEEIRQGGTTECPICLESASDDPVLTPCAHRMCRECLLSSWRSPDGGPCPLCRNHISKSDLIILPAQCRFQVDAENSWKDSCKVSKLIMILEDLQKKKEKSIIFSQFTSFFDLLEFPFNHKGIKFLRYDGKLSQKHKEKVLKEFSESQDKLVLLMSLKAGGVGLNLTAASNVFLMDPWWNPAVEEQAIMRIHRIGQKREVQDTVEERMQQVQLRKQRMISGALTDEEVRGARIEHLKMLFT